MRPATPHSGLRWGFETTSKVAASRDPNALELFRAVMIASATIFAAFPPVMINFEADGKQYQERHVDGGTMGQVFVYPPIMDLQDSARCGN